MTAQVPKKPRKPRYLQLSDAQCARAKPRAKPWKLADTHGLFLLVAPLPVGSKGWRWRFKLQGRERTISLGLYPDVSLAAARKARDAAKELVKAGVDPIKHRKHGAAIAANSFKDVADRHLELQATKTAFQTQTKAKWFLSLLKPLHGQSITTITTPDVVTVVKGVHDTIKRSGQGDGADTARRCAALAKATFEQAQNEGLVPAGHNPAATAARVLPPVRSKHLKAIHAPVDVGHLLALIDGYRNGSPVVKLAARVAPYVFLRPIELRGGRWSEVDLGEAVWTVPAERTKMRREHRVPLPRQVVGLLAELRAITFKDSVSLMFPGVSASRPISENALGTVLKRLDHHHHTAHGWRTTASTLLYELGYHEELVEPALGHKHRSDVRDAYDRSQRFEQRRKMLQAYADHLDKLREEHWLG